MKRLSTLFILFLLLWAGSSWGQNLSEGFEGTTFPPDDWTLHNLGDANTWTRYTSGQRTGSACASINYSTTAHNDWLITPQLAPATGDATISFWAKNGSSSWIDEFNVLLSTTGTDIADFTVTLESNVGPGTTYTEYSYDLSPYIGNTVYLAVQAISTNQLRLYLDDFAGPPLYFAPIAPNCATLVSPANAGTDISIGATLNWATGGGGPTGYKFYFGTDNPPTNILNGTDLGNVTTYNPNPDMDYSTTYYWQVIAYNAYGDATGCDVWSFTTMADPTISSFPYSESFDGTTFAPFGWTNVKTAGTGTPGIWDRQTAGTNPTCTPHSGAGMARYNCYNLSAGTKGELITPPLNFPSDDYRVSFWMYRDGGYNTYSEGVNVYYNTTNSSTGGTLLGTINRALGMAPVESTQGWYQYTFTMPSGAGGNGRYIIFEAFSAFGNNIFLDDVTLEENPACPNPTVQTVDNITTTGADLGWTDAAGTDWDLYIVNAGDPAPDGASTPTVDNTTSNPHTWAGGSANQDYDWYVRSDCDAGNNNSNVSPWTGPNTFTTLCDPISSFPHFEDFNSVTTPNLPDCYSQNNANADGDFWKTWTTYGVDGSNCAGLYTDFNAGANNDYLILPQFTLSGNQQLIFSVRARSSSEPNDYRVVLSTTDNLPASFTTELMPLTTVSSITMTEVAPIDLSAYNGNVWIAIHVPAGGLDGYYLYVDDITVEDIPITPLCELVPISKAFGYAIAGGSPTAAQTFTITNTGSGTLTINPGGISLAGTDPADFTLTDANVYPVNLTTGQSVTVQVAFSPITEGAKSASLQVVHDAPGSPTTSALTGTALPAGSLFESFEGTTFPPAGWSTDPSTWIQSTSTAYSGTKSAYYYPTAIVSDKKLITPMLSVVSGDVLSYYAKTGFGTTQTLQVRYSADKVNWTDIGPSVLLTTTFTNYTVDLSALDGGDYFLAFAATTTSSYVSFYVDYVSGPQLLQEAPGCATIGLPLDAASDVNINTTLSWTGGGSGGVPTGYYLYFGTDGGGLINPTSIENGTAQTSPYTPAAALEYNTTYYWKIVPYNTYGSATGCPIWSFTTSGPSCTETATASGNDDDPTIVTINSFPCTGGGLITGMTMDGTIGSSCPTWYSYDIIVNGTTIASSQCNQTGLDLTSYLPITSVSLQSNDEDVYSDAVTLTLTLHISYEITGCSPPSALAASDITATSATLGWTYDWPVDSFFDVWYDLPGGTPPSGGTLVAGVPDSPHTFTDLTPGTTYDAYIRTDCGFAGNEKIDNFWLSMPDPGIPDPVNSGGTMNDPGEDGTWYEYYEAPGFIDWWNIWFYNDPPDTDRYKKIRVGFWVQPVDIGELGRIYYVVNWSTPDWVSPEPPSPAFPTFADEQFIERSPVNYLELTDPGLQWVEFSYYIKDYNPEWVSIDIWGDNIIIPQEGTELLMLPENSLLAAYWLPGMPGGIIVHECLPKSSFDETSQWTGPVTFTTLESCLPPQNLATTDITTNSASLTWDIPVIMPDSFFDVFFGPGSDPFTGTVYTSVEPPLEIIDLEAGAEYSWAVRANCGDFFEPVTDYFWVEMFDVPEPLAYSSGGTADQPELGEDGTWVFYGDDPSGLDWWNIWFYNDPPDTNRMKKIWMGFWLQNIMTNQPTEISYVINWSTADWAGPGYPGPEDEAYIERSAVNTVTYNTGLPLMEWIQLYVEIPDYNPEWISVDIWGLNIKIENAALAPPVDSPLFTYWNGAFGGGIIVHECLPKPDGNASSWVGPVLFNTLCNATDAFPYNEDFTSGVVPPVCWSDIKTNANENWQISASGDYANVEYDTDLDPQDEWLISPVLDFTLIAHPQLSFDWIMSYYWGVDPYDNYDLTCLISADGGLTWPTALWSETGEGVFDSFVWYTETLDLSAYGGLSNVKIAWQYSGADGAEAGLDNVIIERSPFTWTGAEDSDWNKPGNWNFGSVPGSIDKVIIPNVANMPVISGTNLVVDVYEVVLESGATITVQNTCTLNVLKNNP